MTEEQLQRRPEHRDPGDAGRVDVHMPEWFKRLRDQHEGEEVLGEPPGSDDG